MVDLRIMDLRSFIGQKGTRAFPTDGGLLFFNRDTGWNVLCEGEETARNRQRAPRVVQFAITNQCNLACTFCSRDLRAESSWTVDSAFLMLSALADAGVLEVAFGGGEPWAFRGFSTLVKRLHDETPLAVHMTTNGIALNPARLGSIAGCVGQIRVSLYDDNDWPRTIAWLGESGVRFGANYLVTPARLPELEATILKLVALGCPDVLLLSYNGRDPSLHLSVAEAQELARRTGLLARALHGRADLKLDVCWGDRLEPVPRLFRRGDCGAGRDFIVLTSDRSLMPCSFHHRRIPVTDAASALAVWREQRHLLSEAAEDPGCARTPGFGLLQPLRTSHADQNLERLRE